MKALVLGGGSIKGAWQIGALKRVMEKGFIPEIVTGISVGSLNGSLLSHVIGGRKKKDGTISMNGLPEELTSFWKKNVKSPKDVIEKKGAFKLAIEIFSGEFNGLVSAKPLEHLVYSSISMSNIYDSGINLLVGTVNMYNGEIKYFRYTDINFLEYVISSSSIPMLMPYKKISNSHFVDGGLIDSAPIKTAIKAGATEIICIPCHPEKVGSRDVDMGNIKDYSDRIMEIISNNTLNEDIKGARFINKLLSSGVSLPEVNKKRMIDLKVIRPDSAIPTKITDFNSEDVQAMIDSGYRTAVEELSG